jgi:hypothetical protein
LECNDLDKELLDTNRGSQDAESKADGIIL